MIGFNVKTDNNHWYIIGAGAIGCLWAYALRQAGQDVTMILKAPIQDSAVKRHLALQRLSLTTTHTDTKKIDTKKTDTENSDVEINVITASELAAHNIIIEHCIIATKAYDAIAALQSITPALSLSAKVLSLCNGMGMHKTMHQQLQNHSINIQFLLGVTSDGALLQQPFEVRHTGIGHTSIGHYDPQEYTATLLPPCFYLQHSLLNNIHPALWQKMLVNCVINPLTLIHQCKNGELFSNTEYTHQIKTLCEELSFIANNTADVTSNITAVALFNTAKSVANQTAENTSSMLKDSQLGRPLELDYLNGYIVKLAKEQGLACSVNEQLLKALL
jgi:2-dehydropantoate 2-reductase